MKYFESSWDACQELKERLEIHRLMLSDEEYDEVCRLLSRPGFQSPKLEAFLNTLLGLEDSKITEFFKFLACLKL